MKIRDCCDLPKEEKIPEVKQKFQSLFPEEIAILLHQRSKIMGYNQALSTISDLDVKLTIDEKKVKELLDLLQITGDIQMYNHITKKHWIEHAKVELKREPAEKIAKYLKSKSGEIIVKQ